MKYIMVIESGYDADTREFNDAVKALKEAEDFWNQTSEADKKDMKVSVIESVNPDEEAVNHFDGNPLKEWEEGK